MDELDAAYWRNIALKMRELKDEINLLTEQYDNLKVMVAQNDSLEIGHTDLGDIVIYKSDNKTLNKTRGMRVFGERVTANVFDTKTAKKKLSEDEYKSLYDFGDPKVEIKLPKSDDYDEL